eukprot:89500_1
MKLFTSVSPTATPGTFPPTLGPISPTTASSSPTGTPTSPTPSQTGVLWSMTCQFVLWLVVYFILEKWTKLKYSKNCCKHSKITEIWMIDIKHDHEYDDINETNITAGALGKNDDLIRSKSQPRRKLRE